MAQFLTVQEAATLTEKSTSSIRRRIIYPIVNDDEHSERHHIQPSVDEAAQLRIKGENFAWKISDELLRRLMPTESPSEKGTTATVNKGSTDGTSELLVMLRRELDIKNQQITQQGETISRQLELISGLSDRLREGNILIGSLQRQLTLTDGTERATTSVVDATSTPERKGGVAESSSKKHTKTKSKPEKPKRRFFGLFS